jgi:hypothetical protein
MKFQNLNLLFELLFGELLMFLFSNQIALFLRPLMRLKMFWSDEERGLKRISLLVKAWAILAMVFTVLFSIK